MTYHASDMTALEALHPSWQEDVHAHARAQLHTYVQTWLEQPQLEQAELLLSKTWQLGALDACVQVCDVVWLHTPKASVTIRKGACLIRLGRLADAMTLLHTAPELHTAPDNELQGYVLLQLGNALRYQGANEAQQQARATLTEALEQAETQRDGGLVIAVRTALGELALEQGHLETAIEMLGKALGLTEFFSDKRLTIAPLGALAHAHVLWKNPSKAFDLAERAVNRAQDSVDRVGTARAKFASALAAGLREPRQQQTAYTLAEALQAAQHAPHVPLALRIAVAEVSQRAHDSRQGVLLDELQEWLEQATTLNMQPEMAQLTRLMTQRDT